MPSLPQSIPTLPPLDFEHYSEANRRAIYDRIAKAQFSPPTREEIQEAVDEGSYVEMRTPEEAGLLLFYFYGRWLSVSRVPDPREGASKADLWEVLSVEPDPSTPYGISFDEV
ncbi:MAG TPA: hypothetical protein VOA87_18485 [Thermoanaerobaculia bacterium]|nr:hypothetical protein [Thermoanaerobaculia bacterium]